MREAGLPRRERAVRGSTERRTSGLLRGLRLAFRARARGRTSRFLLPVEVDIDLHVGEDVGGGETERGQRRQREAIQIEVDSDARAKKNVVAAIEQVAKRLGNTRAVCRKCYVHPAVIDAYMDGSMMKTIAQRAQRTAKAVGKMTAAEAAVLGLLQRRMSKSIGRTA